MNKPHKDRADRVSSDTLIQIRRTKLDSLLKGNPINSIDIRDFLIVSALQCDPATLEHIENVRKDLLNLDEVFQRNFEHLSMMVIKTYTQNLGLNGAGKTLRADIMNGYSKEHREKFQAVFESPELLTSASLSRNYKES